MSGPTDLMYRCDRCGHTQPFGGPETNAAWWPTHCDTPLRLTNTTDRDGNPLPNIEEHPYGPEDGDT